MKFGSLFSGIGGFDAGLERAGMECAFSVEIDEKCRQTLNRHWPDVPQYDDITTFDGREWRGKVDLLCGGFPCFAAGTLVETWNGPTPIEELGVGSLVLTHANRYRLVTSLMRRMVDSTVVVKAMGVLPIQTTDEHPFWVRLRRSVWNNDIRRYSRVFDPPGWVAAKDLTKNHYLCQPGMDPAIDLDDADIGVALAYLLGRWLGDGWLVTHKRKSEIRGGRGSRVNSQAWKVIICCSRDEVVELRQRIADTGFHATEAAERTVVKFHISDKGLVEFLSDFGRGASNKKIPGWVFRLPLNEQRALLAGYLAADGCKFASGLQRATTTSRELAHGIARLMRTVHGSVTIYHTPRPATCVIEGRTVNQKDTYEVGFTGTNRQAFQEDGLTWVPVRSISPGPATEVFNISVEEDETYVAGGVVVHNCQDLSIAGRREGLEGKRSGLFYEFARVIEEAQPEWIVLENVPGLLSVNSGADFATVLSTLDNLGYLGAWRVLDAQYWGLAQRRKRVFLVGRLGRRGAAEVLLEPEGGGGDPPARSSKGEVVAALTSTGVGTCDADDNQAQAGHLIPIAFHMTQDPITGPISPALSKGTENGCATIAVAIAIRGREGGATAELGDNLAHALRAAEGGSSKPHVLVYGLAENQRGEIRLTDPHLVAPQAIVRRLTPVECCRLQGFDDNWNDEHSDSTRYKQLGNAVAVPVVEWIGKRIVEVSSMTRQEWYEKKGLTIP